MVIIAPSEDIVAHGRQRRSANGVKTDSHDPAHRGEPIQTEDNVVRLPREYLGPREDLVRIGAPDPAATAPPAPEDFWGEGSSDLQSALVGPPASKAAEAPTGGPPRWRHRPHSWPARTPTVIATATAALILAVVAISALGGQRPGPSHPRVASLSHPLAAPADGSRSAPRVQTAECAPPLSETGSCSPHVPSCAPAISHRTSTPVEERSDLDRGAHPARTPPRLTARVECGFVEQSADR